MAELAVQATNGSRERVPLTKDRLVIGRARDSDIVLHDQWLSRHHAEILRREDGFYLIDLGSRNGTLLNGARIDAERLLCPGDRIGLGDYVLTFSWDEPRNPEEDSGDEFDVVAFGPRDLTEVDTKPGISRDDLARQSRLLGILTRTAGALLSHWTLDDLFSFVLAQLLEAIPAQRGAILLLEGDPPEPVMKAYRCEGPAPPRISGSIARRVLAQRVSLLLPRVTEDAELRSKDSVQSLGIRSAVCAPLWLASGAGDEEEVIGLVYLDSLEDSRTFTEEDLRVLTALANFAASKIETARLMQDTFEKQRIEQDLRLAAEIQLGLLPRGSVAVPGYDVAGAMAPCRAVGGDSYDYVLEGGRLLFGLADVAGGGTGAAILATTAKAAVRSHWAEPDLPEAMSRINRMVCQSIPENRYIAFFLGRLEPESGRLDFVNAGLSPPLLGRRSGEVEALEVGGMVLGVSRTASYEVGTTELRPGDALLVYSDGVTETFDGRGEEFGAHRLREAVLAGRGLDAAGYRDLVLGRLAAFCEIAKAVNDRTLVVLRRR